MTALVKRNCFVVQLSLLKGKDGVGNVLHHQYKHIRRWQQSFEECVLLCWYLIYVHT